MKVAWVLVPIVAGMTIPPFVAMNLRMASKVGDMEAAVVLHAVGTLAGLLWVMLGMRGAGFSGLASVPWWALLGGVLGVSCMAAMNRAIPELGVATAIALSVAAQLVTSLLCEHFGWLGAAAAPAGLSRWLGVLLLVAGAFLVQRR